jgi:hypothetical protein
LVPGHSTAAERLAPWNDALLHVLLPVLPEGQQRLPVLLSCDDEAVRAAGKTLSSESAEAATKLSAAVREALRPYEGEGIRGVLDLKYHWSLKPRPRPRPDYLAVICLAVLAASRMGPTETRSTLAYYPRFRHLLGMSEKGGDPGGFHLVPQMFRDLADWLHTDEGGRRGELLVTDDPWPPFVGYCVEQTVFRAADRRVLSEFFLEARFRHRASRLDNLLLLRRWGGRNRLTNHALELVDDENYANRVRAAIAAALRAWDGSVLEKTGGRSYEATLHLLPRPLRLVASAGNSTTIRFEFEGKQHELLPERQVQLPWELLNRSGRVLGDPMSPSGALRMPIYDETLQFELFDEEGLRRVANPASENVWVLSKDPSIQHILGAWRLPSAGELPYPWQAYRDAPVDRIPGVQRATISEDRPQLSLAGGLKVQSGFYLSGYAPYLEAGDVGAGNPLVVNVNGEFRGVITSQERLALPSDGPKTHRVEVPGLAFKDTYHIDTAGAREGYASLSYHPADRESLRAGALPTSTETKFRICGAQILPHDRPLLPIMRRRPHDVIGILIDGRSREFSQPPTPRWLALVDYPVTSRWEVPKEDLVWLLCIADAETTRWLDVAVGELSTAAAEVIRELGVDAIVHDRCGDREAARLSWIQLVRLAEA